MVYKLENNEFLRNDKVGNASGFIRWSSGQGKPGDELLVVLGKSGPNSD